MKAKKIKYKNGGYVKIEKPEPGITVLEMDGKGWWEMFGKDAYMPKKKNRGSHT
jgi:hypothetical protein